MAILQLCHWIVDVRLRNNGDDTFILMIWKLIHDRGRYSTMDNVDGKQARRTGTSSGLGELFEYGLPSRHDCTEPKETAHDLVLSTATA